MDHEETLRTITAMRRQEESAYFCCDYFELDNNISEGTENVVECPSSSSSPKHHHIIKTVTTSSSAPCDASCRQIMFHWMVRVVDFFPTMHRETVAYAMDYLDRFLQTKAGADARRHRAVFQLAAISCLYTAVKIHEFAAVSPKFLEQLSRDEYRVRDVEDMELTILEALDWRMSTPTALAFLRQYMDVLPVSIMSESLHDEVFSLAKYQTEVALGDYKCVTVNASMIAYCALYNALRVLHVENSFRLSWFVSEAAGIDCGSLPTREIQQHFAAEYIRHNNAGLVDGSAGGVASIGYEGKPCSFSAGWPSTGHHSPRTVCKSA